MLRPFPRLPAELANYLDGIHYPTRKEQLVERAQEHGAPEPILEALRNLPDREYHDLADVIAGYGESPP